LADPYSPADEQRREGPPRQYADRYGRFRELPALLIAFSGGLAIMFLFFAAIGAVDIGNALGPAIAACVFALIWIVGIVLRWRSRDTTERITRADRERRGF
jgi:hypothetical protein